jgi:prepilin-type N-terminal cleavage/methylation domain-containing protein
MSRNTKGFTLIELMVVIVIIGVLASLAIPRFTEASDKAKVAEAPRIIASYESAQLAKLAESNFYGGDEDIIFNLAAVNSDSKWFTYSLALTGTATATTGATGTATPIANIGKFLATNNLRVSFDDQGVASRTASDATVAKKYVPNFFKKEAAAATPPAGGGD